MESRLQPARRPAVQRNRNYDEYRKLGNVSRLKPGLHTCPLLPVAPLQSSINPAMIGYSGSFGAAGDLSGWVRGMSFFMSATDLLYRGSLTRFCHSWGSVIWS